MDHVELHVGRLVQSGQSVPYIELCQTCPGAGGKVRVDRKNAISILND